MFTVGSSRERLTPWRLQWGLTLKELRETLRDRRTSVTLFLMPVLLYPLLGLGFRFSVASSSSGEIPEYRISIATEKEARWVMQAIELGDQQLKKNATDVANHSPPVTPKLSYLVPDGSQPYDMSRVVAWGEAELGLRVSFQPGQESGMTASTRVEVLECQRSPHSRDAAVFVRERLHAANLLGISRWAQQRNVGFEFPVLARTTLVKPVGGSNAILSLLPLVLLMMTVTGGVYPAIDLTAGERERNTLEMLMALPVSQFRVLLAKYVAVVSVTLLTGAVNLLAMTVTVYSLQLEQVLFGDSGLTLALSGKLLLTMTVFGLFFSAVLLLVTSSARSFKEAQAYLIPLLILSIAPGLALMVPGWTLDLRTAVIPIVNALSTARGLFEGEFDPASAVVSAGATLLYAVAALSGAAKLFGADAVAIGSESRWSDLFRRPATVTGAPSMTVGWMTVCAMFAGYFFASGFLGRAGDTSGTRRLMASAILTAFLFVGFPVAVALWQRVPLASGFRLHRSRWIDCLAAVILGLSTWPWVFEIVVGMQSLGLVTLDESRLKGVEHLLAAWKAIPVALIVLTLGMVPGLCEELFFRGFFFSSVRQRLPGFGVVLVTAVTFGLFHVVLAGGVAPERLIPSTLMGLLLGGVALRTGSVLPTILLHVTHNSLLLSIASSRDELAGIGWGVSTATHLPASWLGASAVGLVVGVALLWPRTGTIEADAIV